MFILSPMEEIKREVKRFMETQATTCDVEEFIPQQELFKLLSLQNNRSWALLLMSLFCMNTRKQLIVESRYVRLETKLRV